MGGNPIQRKLEADIEAAGGWEKVILAIEDGVTVAAIAKEFGVSRSFFSRVLHLDGHRDRQVTEARKHAAEAMAEQALDIVDAAEVTRDALAKAKMQAEIRQWFAVVRDPAKFGKAQQPGVNITIQEMHLNALREVAALTSRPLAANLPPVRDAEVTPIEPDPRSGDTPET